MKLVIQMIAFFFLFGVAVCAAALPIVIFAYLGQAIFGL